MYLLSKLNPKRMAGDTWKKEKLKAAGVLTAFDPVVRQATGVVMKRMWYRHIDKAMGMKTTARDAKHWKKMAKTFKREIAGVPSQETKNLLVWLEEMSSKVSREALTKEDYSKWLPQFKDYMLSCERGATQNYILKNDLVEGYK